MIVEINFDWEPTAEQMKIVGGETDRELEFMELKTNEYRHIII